MKKLSRKEIEQIAKVQAPKDSQEDPAYPNHTDTDIYVAGFRDGFEYIMDIAEKHYFDRSLTAIIRKELNTK